MTPDDLTRTLAADIRGLALDRLAAGDFTVADIASTLLLPAEVAEQLAASPDWSLDLCIALCARFNIDIHVVHAQHAVSASRPVPEPELAPAPLAEPEASAPAAVAPKPCPPRVPLYAVPPLNSPPRERVWVEPGEVNESTGKTFVKVHTHAMTRVDEMHLTKQRIIDAVQPECIILRRPGNTGDRQIVESSLEPELIFIVQGPSYFEVISVLWKSDKHFDRPTNPGDPDRPPMPKSASARN